MRITEDLPGRIYAAIEQAADPKASLNLRLLLAQIPDRVTRDALASAAYQLAGAWSDSALRIGFSLRADPGAWFFEEKTDNE